MPATFPLVSVVIPMFNVSKYIRTSLDSVLNQTFKNFEVICVDDGCTDNTAEIVRGYDDERITLVSQLNRGLSGARNTGINKARGTYIALLDADDFWAPEKLAYHVNHLHHNAHVGISFCPSWFVDDAGQHMGIGQFPKLRYISSKDVFCRNPIGNGSAAVIRRTLLLDMAKCAPSDHNHHVSYFDERLRQSEDVEFWLRVSLKTHWTIEGIPRPLTFYRVNAGGLSANLHTQFESWRGAVERLRPQHPDFFQKWFSLARAYQYRYLARRAIQSRNPKDAIDRVTKAVMSDPRILLEEPGRTLLTASCALLCLLPKQLYQSLETWVMKRRYQGSMWENQAR